MIGEIYYSRKFLLHKPDNYHPENPGRLWLVLTAIRELGLENHVLEPSPIGEELIYRIHEREYVEKIRELSRRGGGYLDADTYVSPRTWEAAILALGASRLATLSALRYGGMNLALVRPPGHHAGRRGKALGAPTLGFCIFNNSAMAALTSKEETGKALVIDFDAHHGNGTQEIFWDDADVVHIDLHERDIYPGSGDVGEIGGINAKGSKINLPMPHYSEDGDYIYAWEEVVIPIVEEVKPKVVIVSAGFDGFKGDGLTTLKLTEVFYSYAGATLRKYPLAVILEGGYSSGLKKGFPAFIRGYEEDKVRDHAQPSYETLKLVEEVKDILSPWWSL
ncbi:histone deacetylase family protein [Pyrococcus abyssi]|uniref:Histone deacetylase n=1 Tax=Pyrococcus abyssi (strain GE5 / Orsay) TaxID=272844 RepID=Q9UZJ4_PYRAB|nr:histone deacetylase family protein [Pyrococcus abyssi]CAB50063.1 Histone deacetylase [Pyrococcus abyssi GE5]CCE70569.1 TPA: histone deacetylase related [Pyrococcus abyssi GE5]